MSPASAAAVRRWCERILAAERGAARCRRPCIRSSGHRGYSSEISADPRRVFARKLEREIDVRFTPVACTVQTSEGVVHAAPGDAIITGTAGEHWRVSRARFADKYRPVPPTVAGQSGRYISLPNRIMAVPMTEPFEVLLADGSIALERGSGRMAGRLRRRQSRDRFRTPSLPRPMKSTTDMALHNFVQRLLLIGAHVQTLPPAPVPQAPAALLPLIEAIAGPHRRFDERAMLYGNRYLCQGFEGIRLFPARDQLSGVDVPHFAQYVPDLSHRTESHDDRSSGS